jgi:hypothetical protein
MVARTGAGTVAARTLAATDGVTVTNGDGVAGAPSFALTGQALALHNLGTSGLIARTGAGTVAGRSIATNTGAVTVSNADGVSGNPTLTFDSQFTSFFGQSVPSSGSFRLPSLSDAGWTYGTITEPSSGTKLVGISTTGQWEEVTEISGGSY